MLANLGSVSYTHLDVYKRQKLYHIGIRSTVSRSTLADAAERRDYRLFEALGQRLIVLALAL